MKHDSTPTIWHVALMGLVLTLGLLIALPAADIVIAFDGEHRHEAWVIKSKTPSGSDRERERRKTLSVPCPGDKFPIACHARITDDSDCDACKVFISLHECTMRERSEGSGYECFCAATHQGGTYSSDRWRLEVRAVCQYAITGFCDYDERDGYTGSNCPHDAR